MNYDLRIARQAERYIRLRIHACGTAASEFSAEATDAFQTERRLLRPQSRGPLPALADRRLRVGLRLLRLSLALGLPIALSLRAGKADGAAVCDRHMLSADDVRAEVAAPS